MTHSISAEWCRKMMALDEHVTPGAGALAARPYVEADALSLRTEETRLAFARFVNMARRKQGLTIEKLAEDADIEIGELMSIEEDAHHEPDLRTVWSPVQHFWRLADPSYGVGRTCDTKGWPLASKCGPLCSAICTHRGTNSRRADCFRRFNRCSERKS